MRLTIPAREVRPRDLLVVPMLRSTLKRLRRQSGTDLHIVDAVEPLGGDVKITLARWYVVKPGDEIVTVERQ
jgi:hypothetical protein